MMSKNYDLYKTMMKIIHVRNIDQSRKSDYIENIKPYSRSRLTKEFIISIIVISYNQNNYHLTRIKHQDR